MQTRERRCILLNSKILPQLRYIVKPINTLRSRCYRLRNNCTYCLTWIEFNPSEHGFVIQDETAIVTDLRNEERTDDSERRRSDHKHDRCLFVLFSIQWCNGPFCKIGTSSAYLWCGNFVFVSEQVATWMSWSKVVRKFLVSSVLNMR